MSFRISTTDLVLRYAERARTTVVVVGSTLDGRADVPIEIAFDLVAEVRCVSMNFFEAEHGEYTVEEAEQVDPRFYSVRGSPWLLATEARYDPKGRLGLRHFLVAGYDSYVELLAASYAVTVGA